MLPWKGWSVLQTASQRVERAAGSRAQGVHGHRIRSEWILYEHSHNKYGGEANETPKNNLFYETGAVLGGRSYNPAAATYWKGKSSSEASKQGPMKKRKRQKKLLKMPMKKYETV